MNKNAHVFTIPSGVSFVDGLAAGLLARHGRDPLELSQVLVLLPTRRALRSLREAFLRISNGTPLLLPSMRPIGDLDEDEMAFNAGDDFELPPAIPSLTRLMLLARFVRKLPEFSEPATAIRLAEALGGLLDELAIEQIDIGQLDNLVPDDYAAHWQRTLAFLKIVTEQWPLLLAERGMIDVATRRNALILRQAMLWARVPPNFPIYIAGSTGSVPATAELMQIVAKLPMGAVVLPGLDLQLDDEAWEKVAAEPAHAQYGLCKLLNKLKTDRRLVEIWSTSIEQSIHPERLRLFSEALRPAATSDAWATTSFISDAALQGLSRIDASSTEEEAAAISLLLREALERPGYTAALVTPDRALARRVAADLWRYDIEIDDSAGTALDATAPGRFLRLVADMLAQNLAPVPLLAALKHPLACGGQERATFRAQVRRLEQLVLRGLRPAPGFNGLDIALSELGKETASLRAWLASIATAAQPCFDLTHADTASLFEIIHAHVAFAEWLATTTDGLHLWDGEAGEALANFIADLLNAAEAAEAFSFEAWPTVLSALMEGRVVRPRYGRHPRLFIWGPLEARLQQADLIILGGLNEGTWPADVGADPWFSRPMRQALGLSPPERFIGLAAHDFQQAATAPEVVLSRAAKKDGAETVPSRWLLRLESLLQGIGSAPIIQRHDAFTWARLRDRPKAVQPVSPPEPRPAVALRPRRLSATRVETWLRDPYAIFARYILKLKVLDPLDTSPSGLDRGIIIHTALDAFIRDYPDALPSDPLAALIEEGEKAFAQHLSRPGVRAFWWPRFLRLAQWFIDWEQVRRLSGIRTLATEIDGEIVLPGPNGPFTISAKADRIDLLPDGSCSIIDYKTSAPPERKEVLAGFKPQLPIEGAILQKNGFMQLAERSPTELAYLRLSGSREPGSFRPLNIDVADTIACTIDNLQNRIAQFDQEEMPYLSRLFPQFERRAGPYDHLARVLEWSSDGTDE